MFRVNYLCEIQHETHTAATPDPCRAYRELFASLETAATDKIDQIMCQSEEMTEPFIAYEVARTLPPGAEYPKLTSYYSITSEDIMPLLPFGLHQEVVRILLCISSTSTAILIRFQRIEA